MMSIRKALSLAVIGLGAPVILFAPVLAHPAATAAAVSPAAAAAEVQALARDHIAAFNARDAVGATAIQTADYLGFFHGMPNTVGHEADLAITKVQVADPAMNLVVGGEHVDVAQSGDMATWRCTYRFTYTDPATKQARVEHGNYIIGFKRQPDGKMKAAWSVVSDTPPPTS